MRLVYTSFRTATRAMGQVINWEFSGAHGGWIYITDETGRKWRPIQSWQSVYERVKAKYERVTQLAAPAVDEEANEVKRRLLWRVQMPDYIQPWRDAPRGQGEAIEAALQQAGFAVIWTHVRDNRTTKEVWCQIDGTWQDAHKAKPIVEQALHLHHT